MLLMIYTRAVTLGLIQSKAFTSDLISILYIFQFTPRYHNNCSVTPLAGTELKTRSLFLNFRTYNNNNISLFGTITILATINSYN